MLPEYALVLPNRTYGIWRAELLTTGDLTFVQGMHFYLWQALYLAR